MSASITWGARVYRHAVLVGLTLVLSALGGAAGLAGPREVIPENGVSQLRVLSQHWSHAEARQFYNTPQGSKLLHYRWFLHLEQPRSEDLFLAPAHIQSLGYLARTAGPGNPDGLPVGFVRDGEHLGLTCAACHTTQINYQGQAWLIDGGPTLADIETFQRRLVEALAETESLADKFQRFSRRVLGPGATASQQEKLRAELRRVVASRRGYVERNFPRAGAPPFGPGRLDAFGAILNEVTATFARLPDNHRPADAPVSYPFIWDTPQHDRVQWNGAAENNRSAVLGVLLGTPEIGALGRNVGEVLGVFGVVDTGSSESLLGSVRYPSSIQRDNLIFLEELVRGLWSPSWPDAFPRPKPALVSAGRQLFREFCLRCHNDIDRRDENRRVIARMDPVGTDQRMAANFALHGAPTGVFEGRLFLKPSPRRFGTHEPRGDLLIHTVQAVLLGKAGLPDPFGILAEAPSVSTERDFGQSLPLAIHLPGGDTILGDFQSVALVEGKIQRAFTTGDVRVLRDDDTYEALPNDVGQFTSADGATIEAEELAGARLSRALEGTLIALEPGATVEFPYKGRPLNGIWATAPYLHNGSVPNLDELLKPAAERQSPFRVGSREFDPEKVGFRSDVGPFAFDATLPGNSNAGHEYSRPLTEDERQALIEYLKTL